MKKLNVNDFKIFKDFWILEGEKVNVVFSNAKMDRSFNRNTEEGINNLLSLKEEFKTDENPAVTREKPRGSPVIAR